MEDNRGSEKIRLQGQVTAVLDIGSNSVRLALFGGQTEKRLITSRLGEGMGKGLAEAAMTRTIEAVKELKEYAAFRGAGVLYAFATEAVRKAENGCIFLDMLKSETGVDVTPVSGEREAALAAEGALCGEDGAVIDLGGASTEVAVMQEKRMVYSCSVGVGAVLLKDACGADKNKLAAFIAQKTQLFGDIPHADKLFAVGGTATSLAACILNLAHYDPQKIHGARISVESIEEFGERAIETGAAKIYETYPVDKKRAEIIAGGAMLLAAVAKKAGHKILIASESDNLEGFYNLVRAGKIGAKEVLL